MEKKKKKKKKTVVLHCSSSTDSNLQFSQCGLVLSFSLNILREDFTFVVQFQVGVHRKMGPYIFVIKSQLGKGVFSIYGLQDISDLIV